MMAALINRAGGWLTRSPNWLTEEDAEKMQIEGPLQGPDGRVAYRPMPGGGGAHVPRNQGEAPGVCGEVKYECLSTT